MVLRDKIDREGEGGGGGEGGGLKTEEGVRGWLEKCRYEND